MSGTRHFTASAVVFNADEQVLLIRHVKSGLWLVPGGHIGADESLAEAAVREVREETGVTAAVIGDPVFSHPAVGSHVAPWAVIEADVIDAVNGPHRHIDHLVVCVADGDTALRPAAGEVRDARWVGLADIGQFGVPPELPRLIRQACEHARRAGAFATGQAADTDTDTVIMVTTNPAKAATAREHLAPFGITVEHAVLDLEEIQVASVEEVAAHKAKQAYAVLRRPVIAEDGGFFIEGLGDGQFPGSLAKPVTAALGVEGIIALAGLTPDRAAHFRSAVACASRNGVEVFTSTGRSGRIAGRPAPRRRDGAWSVLWDIWIPPGASQPLSALSDNEYAAYRDSWRDRSVFTLLGRWLRDNHEPPR